MKKHSSVLWNPDSVIAEVKKRIKQLDMIISACNKGLLHDDGTSLIHRNVRNSDQFYTYRPDLGRHYLSKRDTAALSRLAQQSYDRKLLKLALKEQKDLIKVLSLIERNPVEQAFDRMDTSLKLLVNSRGVDKGQVIQTWMAETSDVHNSYDKPESLITARGENVRSKSELLIADRLDRAGIPYKYEFPFQTSDHRTIYPDFTILHPQTLEVYYWEHFGMMVDEEYVENMIRKVNDYIREGINPRKNLIITYETKLSPINTLNVDSLIKTYFL